MMFSFALDIDTPAIRNNLSGWFSKAIQKANRMIPLFKKTAITSKKYPSNYSTIVKKYKKK